jgi:hypothetical protein
MRKSLLVLLLCAAALASQEAPFSESAVWSPKPGDEEETWVDMRQCGAMHAGGSPGAFEACVGHAMQKHGAPEAAIAFNKATGGNAYATKFQPSKVQGPVDLMYAMNPFLANSNQQVFFVNGQPAVISADEQAMHVNTKSDASFQKVRKLFPNAFLLPHVEGLPIGEGLSKGEGLSEKPGQNFTFRAPIVDGCHACARLAMAHLRYEFDERSRFIGVRIEKITRENKNGANKRQ